MKIFRNVIRQFASIMPFPKPPELVNEWDYLYERSIGCVGILKDWLTRALARALRRNAQTIEHEDLRKTALSISKVRQLLTECLEGEMKFQETEDDLKQLRINMGLDEMGMDEQSRGGKSTSKRSTPPRRKQRPGTRNPKRDKVGIANVAG